MKPHVKEKTKKRVFVGLSGGVDSAVTAALLQQDGYAVTGVFIKGWYPPELPCTWAEDRRDAMRIAAHLGIPFVTLDASQEYKQAVIDYLIREYGAGRTPNPDIMCNRDVKFGAFYHFAKKHEADFIATGHYAKTKEGKLFRGADPAKDQSYFLWAVPRSVLAHTLFPLSAYTKEKVRALARRFTLPVSEKKDSQGICFLGSVSVEDFLRSEVGVREGIARDETGKELGTHEGAALYTFGERASLKEAPSGPWFVVAKDHAKNEITVSKHKQHSSPVVHMVLTDVNLIGTLDDNEQLEAQYRYHGPMLKGVWSNNTFSPTTPLTEPLAPGQSLVLYRGNECVGGGIIS
ncbi:tRNA 2-thiouridine(34) synthase MnmA [Candidatus Parcubacteria bacterium]|nr:tRNA 2-thiouridine(34) synthase MnmA [Candidatus Parcubacteria bacterium]